MQFKHSIILVIIGLIFSGASMFITYQAKTVDTQNIETETIEATVKAYTYGETNSGKLILVPTVEYQIEDHVYETQAPQQEVETLPETDKEYTIQVEYNIDNPIELVDTQNTEAIKRYTVGRILAGISLLLAASAFIVALFKEPENNPKEHNQLTNH